MVFEDSHRYFRIAAREIADRLNGEILKLEKGDRSAESVRGLLRQSHMLSGAARIVKLTEIVNLATEIDDLMAPYCETSCTIPREHVAQLRIVLDAINAHLAKLSINAFLAIKRAAESEPIQPASNDSGSCERVRLISA
jgi:chemotaxis protein histidine kinase CheA